MKIVGLSFFVFVSGLLISGCTFAPAASLQEQELPLETLAPGKPEVDSVEPALHQVSTGRCILVQEGRVEGRAFWERTGEPARDGQMVSLISDAGPTLSQRLQNSSYSFPMLARQCGDEVEWVGFSVRYGRGGEYIKPETAYVRLDVYSTGSGSDTPADAKDCVLMLGEIRGRVWFNDKPVADGTIVTASMGPAPVTLEKALQIVETRDGYYAITSVGNCCGDREFWLEWSLSALGEQISVTPSNDNAVHDIFLTSSH